MRVGEQELTLSGADFGKPRLRNGLLIYRKPLPKDFNALLGSFETIRSTMDSQPLRESHLVVKPAQE
jgi:hypothetical protein